MARHLPPEEMLLDYATGNLPEPLAVLVASHLTLSPESRRELRVLEDLGGALLDEAEPAPLAEDALERTMARLDAEPAAPAEAPAAGRGAPAGATAAALPEGVQIADELPAPLRRLLAGRAAAAGWRRRGSVAELDLLADYPGYKTRLLRIAAGARVPQHTHDGAEYTLVLEGSFTDMSGRYARGDVSVADAEVTHQPVAGQECDCICLVVTDAPLKMTGPVGRILNYFVDL
jgi:putative transcriptional regulator